MYLLKYPLPMRLLSAIQCLGTLFAILFKVKKKEGAEDDALELVKEIVKF